MRQPASFLRAASKPFISPMGDREGLMVLLPARLVCTGLEYLTSLECINKRIGWLRTGETWSPIEIEIWYTIDALTRCLLCLLLDSSLVAPILQNFSAIFL
eukprot:gnl/TRDRNA2_/TRDRNA2_39081_c0_seq1.p2 gnl/TRDRNA2_/TRDRNA2_39081_c0~~gnl/TRDRNA2_/TRDRNA2_39081_c0_seq1.p2  ORF type:complete len:101 (-),score=4.88 gnl/TRDRNA2_/TRDRNA2_39081_c0_seq1:539-841(-)